MIAMYESAARCMSACRACLDRSDPQRPTERRPAGLVPAHRRSSPSTAAGASPRPGRGAPARRCRRRIGLNSVGEALDDGPGGVEPEVLHLSHQPCRLGCVGAERIAVVRRSCPPIRAFLLSCCARTASAANRPDRVAPSTHPALRPLSVQSPATTRLSNPVLAGVQTVLVGAGQRLHVAVGGVGVRPPVLACRDARGRSPLGAVPSQSSDHRNPPSSRRPATASPRRGRGMSGPAPAPLASRHVDIAAHVPDRRRVQDAAEVGDRPRLRRPRASPRPAGDGAWRPRCRRA